MTWQLIHADLMLQKRNPTCEAPGCHREADKVTPDGRWWCYLHFRWFEYGDNA